MKKHIFPVLIVLALLAPVFASAQVADVDPNGSSDSACVSLKNNLRYKARDASTGDEVSALQDYLQSENYLSSEPTGYFGLLTLKAVKAFQTANNISPSGYVGPLTRARISALTCLGDGAMGQSGSGEISGGGGSGGSAGGTTTTIHECPPGALYSSRTGESCSKPNPSAPVISGVSGPQRLALNETGTWAVKAYDPSGGNLFYTVNWGEQYAAMNAHPDTLQQSATFTHVYYTAGTYTPTFTVTNISGQSAKTSVTVNVGDEPYCASNTCDKHFITVLSPHGGESWAKGTTQTIKWNGIVREGCLEPNVCTGAEPVYDISLDSYTSCASTSLCPMYYQAPRTIAKSVSGTSFNWAIPNCTAQAPCSSNFEIAEGSYTIRVCQTGTSICDSGDSYFKIVGGSQGGRLSVQPVAAKILVGGTTTLQALYDNCPSGAVCFAGPRPVQATWNASNNDVVSFIYPPTCATCDPSVQVKGNAAGTSIVTATYTDASGVRFSATAQITVAGDTSSKPDIMVSSVVCNPSNPKPYELIYCDVTVYNNSPVNITKSFDVNIQGQAMTVNAPLNAWEKRTIKDTKGFGLTILGKNELNFPADIWNSVDESNENNNMLTVYIYVGGANESGRLYIEPSRAEIKVGNSITLKAMFDNCPIGAMCFAGPRPVQATWTSNNKDIASLMYPPICATCSPAVQVMGNAAGTATISASYVDSTGIEMKATAQIIVIGVTPPPIPVSPITVVLPNGGEVFRKGTEGVVDWKDSSTSQKLYDINLISYMQPCPSGSVCPMYFPAQRSIAKAVPGFHYEWPLPNCYSGSGCPTNFDIPEGSYLVQVCQSGTSVCDSSDTYFKIINNSTTAPTPPPVPIWPTPPPPVSMMGSMLSASALMGAYSTPYITVLTPNGGEKFVQGKESTLSWKGNGLSAVSAYLVTTDARGNALTPIGIIGNVSANVSPDSYSTMYWDGKTVCNDLNNCVRSNVRPGAYKVFLVGNVAGEAGKTVNDMSDATFSISAN